MRDMCKAVILKRMQEKFNTMGWKSTCNLRSQLWLLYNIPLIIRGEKTTASGRKNTEVIFNPDTKFLETVNNVPGYTWPLSCR